MSHKNVAGEHTMKKLPIGVSNLREIIEEGYAYVDKSRHVHQLDDTGKYYFLSRPRRFGKSLFIDTLKEAFEGNRDLFENLWLHDHWDWEKKYPVIHISFGSGVVRNREELDRRIVDILYQNQKNLGITCRDPGDIPGCFGELIRNSADKYGQRTVVLVDEIANQGQWPDTVVFVGKGLDETLFVTHDGQLVYSLSGKDKQGTIQGWTVVERFVDGVAHVSGGAFAMYANSELRGRYLNSGK